jgi:hypothetical protein
MGKLFTGKNEAPKKPASWAIQDSDKSDQDEEKESDTERAKEIKEE